MAKYTQVEKRGIFELTESARTELESSKYYSDELAPPSAPERTWTKYNFGMLWIGVVLCVPTVLLTAGLIARGISPWLAVVNVTLGALIALIPAQLMAQPGARYGVSFPLLSRLSFGMRGAVLPIILRVAAAFVWCAVLAWSGGAAIAALTGGSAQSGQAGAAGSFSLPSWAGMQDTSAAAFVGYIVILVVLALLAAAGTKIIKWVQSIGGPVMIVIMIILLVMSLRSAGAAGLSFGDVMSGNGTSKLAAANGGTAKVFLSGLMGSIGIWTAMVLCVPDFTRFAKKRKAQNAGQILGLPLGVLFCAIAGAVITQVMKLTSASVKLDDMGLLSAGGGSAPAVLGAIGIIAGVITTSAAADFSASSTALSGLAPKKLSRKVGAIISLVITLVVCQGWLFAGSGKAFFSGGGFSGWVNLCGSVLAPVLAILIADYFVCKEKRISAADLFTGEEGRYWYSGGVNGAAVLAWIIAVILPILAMFPISGGFGEFLGIIKTVNVLVAFFLGFVLYIAFMKSGMKKNSFVGESEHEKFTDRLI